MTLKELVNDKLNKFQRIRADFSINNINVSLMFNKELFYNDEYIIFMKNNNTNDIFLSTNKFSYKNGINVNIDFDYNSINNGSNVNNIRYQIFKNKGDNAKFWESAFNAVSKVNKKYEGKIEKDLNITYGSKNNEYKLYFKYVIHVPMSSDKLKYLVKRFNLDWKYMLDWSKSITFGMTNDNDPKDLELHNKFLTSLKNKTFDPGNF